MDTPPVLRPLARVAAALWLVGWGVLALGAAGITLFELYPWLRGTP